MSNVDINTPHAKMVGMITGKWVSQAVYAAAELGIADLLAEREQTVEELASATNTNVNSLYRLLRALSNLGVFVEREHRLFQNNPLGETLICDKPGSLRDFTRLQGIDTFWAAWGEILHCVKTGKSSFEHITGKDFFEYISDRPIEAQIYDGAMSSWTQQTSEMVLRAYDFSHARTIVDVGGGQGLLLISILKANPQAQGILFELPRCCPEAKRLIAEHGLTDRIKVIPGNALESISSGGDVYIMRHIIHDWNDDIAFQFMKNCSDAMLPGSKLLLIEAVVTPPGTPHFSKLLDLEMMVLDSGAQERTIDDYQRLYSKAGLTMKQIIQTEGIFSIIEGVKL